MQAIKALNGADVNLFCSDTGSIQGRSIFVGVCFSTYFKNQKVYLKKTCCQSSQKLSFNFVSCRNLPLKDSPIKMPRHAKLSYFAYVISGERSTNQQKQLQNHAFHVKTSQSARNQLDPAKNENPFCMKAFN